MTSCLDAGATAKSLSAASSKKTVSHPSVMSRIRPVITGNTGAPVLPAAMTTANAVSHGR